MIKNIMTTLNYLYTFFNFIINLCNKTINYGYNLYNSFLNTKTISDNNYLYNYPYKYEDDFEQLENIVLDNEFLKNIKDCFVSDETPGGEIIMSYDYDDDLFFYYSNNTNIQYRFLDTVAMKYVIANNCKSIYKFMKEELINIQNDKEKEKEKEKENEKEKEKESNNLFVNFKKYNKKASNDINKIKQNLNKFKRMGNLMEYEKYINNLKNPLNEPSQRNINYRDFKHRKFNSANIEC